MDRGRPVLLLIAVWSVALLGSIWPVLFSGRELAFRDAGHYYPPYVRLITESWANGPPFWNHFEERGRPLLADPTAAVFYPGSFLFLLPLRFERLWHLYLLVHILLAAAGCYRAARTCNLAPPSAALASLGYAFGGFVLFQVHNLPYLIGAAWLPWVLGCALHLLEHPRYSTIAGMAASLAMMILGGDLQTAYLTGIACLFAWAYRWRRSRQSVHQPTNGQRPSRCLVLLSSGLLLGLSVSAIQLLPTWHWTQGSTRWVAANDRFLQNTFRHSEASSSSIHEVQATRQRYDYSVGPWRWPELLLPNASGRMTPSPTRWTTALPYEGRAWSPSLYMGLMVAMLALHAMFHRGERDWRENWLLWIAAFGVVGSLGRYGLLWLLTPGGNAEPSRDAWGGLYWALGELLPGFRVFRYPAKLWIWTSFSVSLLAGHELQRWLVIDRIEAEEPRSFMSRTISNRILACVLLTVLVSGGGVWAFAADDGYLSRCVPPDALFGPLDVAKLRSLMVASMLQSLVMCLLWRTLRSRWRRLPSGCGWIVVAISAVDLAIAHRDLIPTVPAMRQLTATMIRFPGESTALGPPRYMRMPSGTWYPADWSRQASPERLGEGVRWDAATLRPKYHLDLALSSLRGSTSFSSASHLGQIVLVDELYARKDSAWVDILRVLGCQFVVAPTNQAPLGIPGERAIRGSEEAMIAVVPQSFPRAWVVHQCVTEEPRPSVMKPQALQLGNIDSGDSPGSVAAWHRRLHEKWILEGRLRQFRSTVFLPPDTAATVDESPTPPPEESPPEPAGDDEDTCEWLGQSARSLRFRVKTKRAGWLVLNDSYDPGWQATVTHAENSQHAIVRRANDVMMVIEVPAGETFVSWAYVPPGYHQGQVISAIAMLVLIALATRRSREAPATDAGQ